MHLGNSNSSNDITQAVSVRLWADYHQDADRSFDKEKRAQELMKKLRFCHAL